MQNPAHEPVPIIGSDTSAIYLFFSTADLIPKNEFSTCQNAFCKKSRTIHIWVIQTWETLETNKRGLLEDMKINRPLC